MNAGEDTCHDRTLFRDQELTRTQDVTAKPRQAGTSLRNRENRSHVFKAGVEQDFLLSGRAASGRRTASVISAPASASVRTVSMPIPAAPPVTMTRLPVRSTPAATSVAVE